MIITSRFLSVCLHEGVGVVNQCACLCHQGMRKANRKLHQQNNEYFKIHNKETERELLNKQLTTTTQLNHFTRRVYKVVQDKFHYIQAL